MDSLDLQRLITALLMPLPLGLLLAGAGLTLLAASRWRRGGWLLAVGGLVTILLAALPGVSHSLMARPYPPRLAAACPQAEAIVLLGGALQPLLAGESRGRLHRGSDRAWEAAQLWHAGCAPWVVVSAGGLIEPPVVAGESAALADLLNDLGVPATALIVEADSRNTQGNAAFTHAVLAPLGLRRVRIDGDAAPALRPGDVIVRVDPRYFRPAEVETLLGDPTKAKERLGWVPEISVQAMCAEMVAEDLKVAKRHAFLKAHGHETPLAVED